MSKEKRDLSKSKQVHGALETKQEESLYSFMGINTFPYREKTAQEYRATLDQLTLNDLQRHAVEIANIIPNTMSRHNLIDKLEREFLKKQNAFVDHKKPDTAVKLNKKQEQDIRDLLSRGR
jgi:hypothetical protein